MNRYIAYYRVSTKRQGESGLGLDAQREAVLQFVRNGELVGEFEEVESGRKADRPALDAALRACRLRSATLVIAKLDRLSRSVTFISKLLDEGVSFQAVDLPHASSLTVGIMASVAQHEREMISTRTRQALTAAKARGIKLGGRRGTFRIEDHGAVGRERSLEIRSAKASALALDRLAAIEEVQASGKMSLRQIAGALNDRGVPAPRGGEWSAGQVRRVLLRSTTNSLGGRTQPLASSGGH